jgi:PAS domain S-box-containing protein
MAQSADTKIVIAELRTDELLEASELRLRLALQAADLGIWDWDVATGRMVYSDRARAICGFEADREVTLEDARSVTHPDDLPLTWAQRERAFDPAIRDRSPYEYRVVRPDGIVRWVRAHGEVLFQEVDGAVAAVRYTGTIQDITEEREREAARRLAEEQLRQLNACLEQRVAERTAERNLLATIVETTDAFVQAADRHFTWLAINPAAASEFERIFGVRPAAGDNMLALLAEKPEHQAAVRAVWARALAGEEFEEIGEFGDPALDRRAYRMRYNALRSGEGVPYGAFQIVTDVTEELRQQRALADAEAGRRELDALYRAYFENTADPLFVVRVEADGGFLVEQTNPAHEATFGFEREVVRGRRMDELLPPDLHEQVVSHYRRCVAAGTVIRYRDTFDLPAGLNHSDTVLVPLKDESGRVVRLVGSSRDVTRQVQAEEALRQAQKMEAVGQLTGGIAHDFNNLLGAMMGALDLIRRKAEEPDRVRRLAEAGIQAAERGARLTSQLLAFARAQRLELQPLIVSDLVSRLGDLLERTLGPMISLAYDLHRERRTVRADPTQLEMAVLNLAINARDAMPEGGLLTLSTRLRQVEGDAELAPGSYIELSVTDTGAGMSPDVAARALDPFFTTKGVGKGTGLGLSQVYGMARQSGGTVRLTSEPGQGTVVRILLPCADEAATAAEAEIGLHPRRRGGGALVLLVDDDAAMRRMLSEALAALGHRVIEAEDGASALAAARQHVPAVAILDFAMPGMNGAEVARHLRDERPDLPVLFASGYADTDAIKEVAGESVRLLRKPFRLDALEAAIDEALRGRRH